MMSSGFWDADDDDEDDDHAGWQPEDSIRIDSLLCLQTLASSRCGLLRWRLLMMMLLPLRRRPAAAPGFAGAGRGQGRRLLLLALIAIPMTGQPVLG